MPVLNELAADWNDLETRADGSFFLSWHWIGSWLKCLPPNIAPEVLYVRSGERVVGLAMIVAQARHILRFVPCERLLVNQTGDRAEDVITIEYSGILADREISGAVIRSAHLWLMHREGANQIIHLGGIDSAMYMSASDAARAAGRREHMLNQSPAPFVDLDHVRCSGDSYQSHLSRNSRQNLRRAQRAYEKRGQLTFTVAQTRTQAGEFLAELKQLHQHYWNDRDQPGSFSSPFFETFHEELLDSGFAAGHIEVSRTTVGSDVIGYLYNFIWRGTVYAYQSGLHYEKHNQFRPGYICHTLAIEHALAQNMTVYDFMAGQAQHKRSLSTGTQELVWVEFRNRGFATSLESGLRQLKSTLQSRIKSRKT